MKWAARLLPAVPAAALLAGCASGPAPGPKPVPVAESPRNFNCGDLRLEQSGKPVESDGSSVTLRRDAFRVVHIGEARGLFRLHAASPNSPMASAGRVAPKRMLLAADSMAFPRAAGDLRLAGFSFRFEGPGTQGSSYSAGPQASTPRSSFTSPPDAPAGRTLIGRADFNAADAGVDADGKPVIAVEKIQGSPVAGSRWPVLHLLSMVGALPPVPGTAQDVAWSTCTVFFE